MILKASKLILIDVRRSRKFFNAFPKVPRNTKVSNFVQTQNDDCEAHLQSGSPTFRHDILHVQVLRKYCYQLFRANSAKFADGYPSKSVEILRNHQFFVDPEKRRNQGHETHGYGKIKRF